jgi:SsrA-binding protein
MAARDARHPVRSGRPLERGPDRPRKLLLNGAEIRRLIGATQEKGLALVPLELYFRRGLAKIDLALGRGKKLHDKRETLKRKTHQREMERELKKY